MTDTNKNQMLEIIKRDYEAARKLAREIWLISDSDGNSNDRYFYECGFVAGLNYANSEKYKSDKKRLEALQKLSDLDQELGLY